MATRHPCRHLPWRRCRVGLVRSHLYYQKALSMRSLLFAAATLLLAGLSEARPNVLLIVADDLGWRDLGVTGSELHQTPHLDGLFASGIQFERSYASCRVCSPTRASLLTGKAPARHGITDWIGAAAGEAWERNTPALPAEYTLALPAEETTLAEALRAAGYRTFFAGKWHLGGEGSLPTDHGFEINLGGHHRGSPPGGYFSPYGNPYLTDGPPGEHLPMRLGAETAAFVESESDRPFFAMLSFYSVHGPLQTTRKRWGENRLEALAKPAPAGRFGFDRTIPVRQVQDHPVYAGMVEAMDDAVGLVLEAVAQSGKYNDTIVIFTSDNGGVSSGDGRATSNLPLRGGKGKQWEAGFRVPLGIAWPSKVETGQRTTTRAISTDLYPTILDLCGLPADPEQHPDGVSLSSVLQGGGMADRPLFWHYPHYGNQGGEPSSVVVRGDWKLIRYHEDGREELYDLANDPGEQNDLADQYVLADEGASQAISLARTLTAWLTQTGAKMPIANPRFDTRKASQNLLQDRCLRLPMEERLSRQLLKEDWQPNPTWWGSQPTAKTAD